MTESEARELYRRIFTASPDYLNWLQEKVADPAKTLGVWYRMLQTVPQDAGDAVVCKIESGEKRMPEAYERGALGTIFRSWCMAIIDERKKAARNEQLLRDGSRDAHKRVYADPCMGQALRAMNAADDAYSKGEIDGATRDRIKREARRMVNPKSGTSDEVSSCDKSH